MSDDEQPTRSSKRRQLVIESDEEEHIIISDDETPRPKRKTAPVNYTIPEEDDIEFNDGEQLMRSGFEIADMETFKLGMGWSTEEFQRKFFIEMTQSPSLTQIPLVEYLMSQPCSSYTKRCYEPSNKEISKWFMYAFD